MKRLEDALQIAKEIDSLAVVFGGSMSIVEGLDQIVSHCDYGGDIASRPSEIHYGLVAKTFNIVIETFENVC
jgi:hypothetical protein